MATPPPSLAHLDGLTLTDSGIETDVIFGTGRYLPSFAVFPLLEDDEGRAILDRYYREHVAVAEEHGLGYVFETPSWRSNRDWGTALGYSQAQLDDLDRAGVAFLEALRAESTARGVRISGLLGPRGDGYVVDLVMSHDEARDYHGHQIVVLAEAGCDLVSACTLTYPDEGLGIALAARDAGVPVVLYFTLETDGLLPDGSRLGDAITRIDAAIDGYVAYYGVNCAHPDHMLPAFVDGGAWVDRIGAIRANASRMSHAELDEAAELDAGDPSELAEDYRRLRAALPNPRVFGGCCGTDVRHVRAIASVLRS